MIDCFDVIERNLNFRCSYRIRIQQNDSVTFRPAQCQMVSKWYTITGGPPMTGSGEGAHLRALQAWVPE